MSGIKVVMVSSEMAPFAKTGGLADVVGALPGALARRGNSPCVIMPKYSSIQAPMEPYHSPMGVWMGNGIQEWCSVYRSFHGEVPVYFIEHNAFFDRPGLYNDSNMNGYADNARRFAFLSRAALQLCVDKEFRPDVFHVHDWQTALAPAYLRTWNWQGTPLDNVGSLLTIHNIAYQGNFDKNEMGYLGIDWQNFTLDKFEENDRLNILKGGIAFADAVNTVSPTYAGEITSGGGYGLDGSLRSKGHRFGGILNGADYDVWSPEKDRYIPHNFSKEDLSGKWACKSLLQEMFGLRRDPGVPIFGIVGRFTQQKGYNLLAPIVEGLMRNTPIQIVMLGTGDRNLEDTFNYFARNYGDRFGCHTAFDEGLAHLIEAGSDFFVMPSLFEPCGLNQMYSLRYGTLPIVRATGGLNDTVENYNADNNSGTGFKFRDFTADALYGTMIWAARTYFTRPDHMAMLRWNAMSRWFGWDSSAEQYEHAYRMAMR